MRTPLSAILAVLVFGAVLCAPLTAQAKKNVTPDGAFDPKAVELFQSSCSYLASLKGYAFKAEVLLDQVYDDGSKVQVARNMDVAVQRPNAFKIVTNGDDFSAVSVYDGKTFSMALPEKKRFGQLPAALDIDAIVSLLAEKYDLESPLSDLLLNDPCSKMGAISGKYLGLGLVGQTNCHHLYFEGREIDWQLWIEDGPQPLPRKLVITEKRMAKSPQFTAFLKQWRIADNPPTSFVFAPAQDLTRDEKFFPRKAWKR